MSEPLSEVVGADRLCRPSDVIVLAKTPEPSKFGDLNLASAGDDRLSVDGTSGQGARCSSWMLVSPR